MIPRERHNLTHSDDFEFGRVYDITTVRQNLKLKNRKRNRCIALTDCVATLPDGSTRIIRRNRKIVQVTPPNKSVRIRRRTLKYDITTYIAYAERFGLDPAHVAELYRNRRDNGYTIEHDVPIEMNATFRGGDH